MRLLILTTALGLGLSVIPASAVDLTCNPAVQNWQNGSGNTCPYQPGNAGALSIVVIPVPTYVPPPDEEVDIPD